MTHNKYFFSGRMMAIRQTPEAGNKPQEFVAEGSNATGPFEKDVLPLQSSADAFGANAYNLNPMLIEVIRMSDMFWDVSKLTTFEQVIDCIYYECKYATPWEPGTHNAHRATGMQSAVRGVSSAGSAGTSYILLLKLFILKLTRQQVKTMLDHPDSPYIRCLGFLYLRVAMANGYKEIWKWFEPYLLDTEEFNIDGSPATKTTIGDYCRRLLTDQDYFGDRLPRIPVLVQRQIDASLKAMAEGKPVGLQGSDPTASEPSMDSGGSLAFVFSPPPPPPPPPSPSMVPPPPPPPPPNASNASVQRSPRSRRRRVTCAVGSLIRRTS